MRDPDNFSSNPVGSFSSLQDPTPHAVTWRSLLVGLIGVVLICGLTPYNDFAVDNTYLVGNFLPLGLVVFLTVLILIINAPLRKWAPGAALTGAELAIVTGMILVSCSIPSSGLMRYLPTTVVGLYHQATERPDYAEVITRAGIPRWLLPDSTGNTPSEIGTSDTFKYYRTRSPDGSIPWSDWVGFFAAWGVLIGLLWTLLMLVSVLVRRQWSENEKLAFPLATVYSSLIESPEPGKSVNNLFRSYGFWISAGLVFGVHSLNALHRYLPDVPEAPLGYNFYGLFTDDPWRYTTFGFKESTLFFSIIGITFFLQSKITFSLWFFFILMQVVHMILGGVQVDFNESMKKDQTFGGILVMTGVILWIGRHHWWMILRHMFGRRRNDETESRYLPYAVAGWATVVCFAGVVIWFWMAGMSIPGAVLLTLVLVMMFMMIARVVAETGLVFAQINWEMQRFWYYPILMSPTPIQTSPSNFFMTGWITGLFHDLRESFVVFFQQGMKVADQSAYPRTRRWQTSVGFLLAVFLALGVGYVTSAVSMVWTEYSYFSTMSSTPISPINDYAINYVPRFIILENSLSYPSGLNQENGLSSAVNIAIGAVVVGLTSVLRLTLAWWPFHPIAFIVLYSYATQKVWFSIFVGWLAKVIVIRIGGANLLKSAKPVFIGLAVGEAFAAGFWLITSLTVHWMGYEYQRISLLPG